MKNETIKLWAFYYNSCIHESSYVIWSYHRTKKGADAAMKAHKSQARKEYDKMYKDDPDMRKWIKFGIHESWQVDRFELIIQD